MWKAIERIMWYSNLKEVIGQYTGLERDALHIHGAIMLYFLAMAASRNGGRSRIPWLVVLVFELANEAHDLYYNWDDGHDWAIAEGIKDLWNTMLWPSILLLLGRYSSWFRTPAEMAGLRRAERVPEPDNETGGRRDALGSAPDSRDRSSP